MVYDLIDAIAEATVRRASQRVLFNAELSLKVLSSNPEISIFKTQKPIKGKLGILVIMTSNQDFQFPKVLDSIVANLVLSVVIETTDQITEVHITRRNGINENLELFVYSLDEEQISRIAN